MVLERHQLICQMVPERLHHQQSWGRVRCDTREGKDCFLLEVVHGPNMIESNLYGLIKTHAMYLFLILSVPKSVYHNQREEKKK